MSGRSFQVVDTIRIANNKLVQVIKMGDVYLVIAVAKDNVTMLAKLTEEEMGLTEAEICKDSRTEWRKRSDDLPGDA